MNQVIFLTIILTVLVIIILLSKINIAIEYKKKAKYDVFIMSFFIYNVLIYKYQIPTIDARKNGIFYRFKKKTSNKKSKKKGKKYIRYKNIIEKIKKIRR